MMNKSNIFVFVELSKLVDALSQNVPLSRDNLKSQAGFFNIIPAKYFSDRLSPEWESITEQIKQKGPRVDPEGNVIGNAMVHTIDLMTEKECNDLAVRIENLYLKVKQELD